VKYNAQPFYDRAVRYFLPLSPAGFSPGLVNAGVPQRLRFKISIAPAP